MSDVDSKMECGTHGTSTVTYVCQHLTKGEKLGFNRGYDPENPDDLYPDAWCNECNDVLLTEGEWNDKSEGFAGIKLVCSHCYEAIRARNCLQADEVIDDLIKTGFQFLEKYKINDHERWDWDQDSGKLIFSHDGIPQVEAEIHFSGTFSTKSNTWMWAWANNSLRENVKSFSRVVRTMGEEQGLLKLAAAHWNASEFDGWEMTAVMAKALQAIGAYRTPGDQGYAYMVITKARWLNNDIHFVK